MSTALARRSSRLRHPYTLLRLLSDADLEDLRQAVGRLVPHTVDHRDNQPLVLDWNGIIQEYHQGLRSLDPAEFHNWVQQEMTLGAVQEAKAPRRPRKPSLTTGRTSPDLSGFAPTENLDLPGAPSPWHKVARRIRPRTENAYAQAFGRGRKSNRRVLDQPGVIGKEDIDRAVEFAKKRSAEFEMDLTQADIKRAKKIIAEGIKKGQSPKTVAQRILDQLNDEEMTKSRAEMIATTETNRALNLGAMWGAAEEGATGKQLITAGDVKVCEDCEDYSQQGVIGIDDLFPGGEVGPPIHPRCRCYMIFDYGRRGR